MLDGDDTALLTAHSLVRWRRLTVDEYYRMAEDGILGPDERVELIEGHIIMMAPVGSPHAGAVNALTRQLVRGVGDRAVVAVQNSVRLDTYSEPQPDVAVLAPRADDYRRATPRAADVLLLIEVSHMTARYDVEIKAPLYARHGLPEFWIVDVGAGEVLVCRDPVGDRYETVVVKGRDDVLEPAALAGVSVPVSSLMD